MSAELQMSSPGDAVEYPYRAISRASVASVVFFLLGLLGLIPAFKPVLALTLVGAIAAAVGLRAIRRYPNEFSGRGVAVFGLAANLLLLVGGVSEHSYIYLTEVPEGYQRVGFYELQQDAGGPDVPTQRAVEIDGEDVFLKGYIHPSSGSGMLGRFILVPDLGTCCFGGQPRSSDMIEVTLAGGQTVRAGLTQRKLAGQFLVNRVPQRLPGFDNGVLYRMRVDQIK